MNEKNRSGFWVAIAILILFGGARLFTVNAGMLQDLVDEPAPKFELESVEGKTVSNESLEGKVVLMDFWAVWCGPCKTSMPFFQEMADKYQKDGLEVVGVHVDDRMPAAAEVSEYLDSYGVRYTNLMSTVDVDNAYMVYAMPTTYMIDREGKVRKRHIGFNPDTTPAGLEEDIREMLGLE